MTPNREYQSGWFLKKARHILYTDMLQTRQQGAMLRLSASMPTPATTPAAQEKLDYRALSLIAFDAACAYMLATFQKTRDPALGIQQTLLYNRRNGVHDKDVVPSH